MARKFLADDDKFCFPPFRKGIHRMAHVDPKAAELLRKNLPHDIFTTVNGALNVRRDGLKVTLQFATGTEADAFETHVIAALTKMYEP